MEMYFDEKGKSVEKSSDIIPEWRISGYSNEIQMLRKIKPGKYRYYKGKEYEVLGLAKHSETLEELVVYRALIWQRPGLGAAASDIC